MLSRNLLLILILTTDLYTLHLSFTLEALVTL
jgi:hypothetical protein